MEIVINHSSKDMEFLTINMLNDERILTIWIIDFKLRENISIKNAKEYFNFVNDKCMGLIECISKCN